MLLLLLLLVLWANLAIYPGLFTILLPQTSVSSVSQYSTVLSHPYVSYQDNAVNSKSCLTSHNMPIYIRISVFFPNSITASLSFSPPHPLPVCVLHVWVEARGQLWVSFSRNQQPFKNIVSFTSPELAKWVMLTKPARLRDLPVSASRQMGLQV